MTSASFATALGGVSLTARYYMAVANALMAAVVGTATLGIGAGIVGALVMAALPFAPVIRQATIEWVIETPIGAALGAFLLFWIGGTIVWGLAFAFAIALVLAPTMLAIVVGLTFIKPTTGNDH